MEAVYNHSDDVPPTKKVKMGKRDDSWCTKKCNIDGVKVQGKPEPVVASS